jgi:Predicted SAM-dependent methyltransferases
MKITLKPKREASIQRFHPWIFSGAVARKDKGLTEGCVVDVYGADGAYLATGHYQEGSITVRILSFDGPSLPADFWEQALRKAYALRERLGWTAATESTAYRLVHGEGDHLPGLIIDYYQGVAVVQAHSAGMFLAREAIAEALRKLYGSSLKAVYDKSAATAPFKAGLDLQDGYLWVQKGFQPQTSLPHKVLENGHAYLVDWESGQKTGFFLDQRENRAILESLAAQARVLNLFCYSGGFSVSALAGGASLVHSVDSSQKAVDLCLKNVVLNSGEAAPHKAFATDAFDFLKNSEQGAYNLMVLDPPAFAKHRGSLQKALQAYKRLNAVAFEKIAPGGIVFSFSCSQVVDKNDFALAVFSAAAISGRRVRILQRLGQSPDHPVNIYHPEGDYLKGLVLHVE